MIEEKESEERRCRCAKKVKSRNTVFFQWFVAPEGRKVGSLKRRVRSYLTRWEMKKTARRCGAKHMSKSKCRKQNRFGPLLEVAMSKKCTPLWREAHFEVKMYKAPHVRNTFGSWDVEKVHAVVARITFRSQKLMYKAHHVRSTFGSWDVVSRGRRTGLCTLSRVSKTWGFCSISKNDGRRWTFEEDLQRCIFRGRCSTRDMFSSELLADFLRGVAFWSIRSSGLLRWFAWQVQHFVWPGITFFVAGAAI